VVEVVVGDIFHTTEVEPAFHLLRVLFENIINIADLTGVIKQKIDMAQNLKIIIV
jgi:hypothetical protein